MAYSGCGEDKTKGIYDGFPRYSTRRCCEVLEITGKMHTMLGNAMGSAWIRNSNFGPICMRRHTS